MSWVEKTFHDVPQPDDEKNTEEEQRLRKIFKNMPPYIKLTSRRARESLIRYEQHKKRHIEAMHDNDVFKFVMQVAGFTNERMEKYWKGDSVKPFMDEAVSSDVLITSEDLDLLNKRAREHALADLNQFSKKIPAIPVWVESDWKKNWIDIGNNSRGPRNVSPEKAKKPSNANDKSPEQKSNDIDYSSFDDSLSSDLDSSDDSEYDPQQDESNTKRIYIYNMNDDEFELFCRYISDTSRYQRDDNASIDIVKYQMTIGSDSFNWNMGTDTKSSGNERNKTNRTGESTNSIVSDSVNPGIVFARDATNVHWESEYAPYYFQRFVARWLAQPDNNFEDNGDLKQFKDTSGILFNNLINEGGVWYRDLTGLQLTGFEALATDLDPCKPLCEVPLSFAVRLFEERNSYWKHELVLGEFDRRSMFQADQWLQRTPWAIGQIYLMPSIYGHMQEAHFAITKIEKFKRVKLEDILASRDHSFMFSKLVALALTLSSANALCANSCSGHGK